MIKMYFVNSKDRLYSIHTEVKDICNAINGRAYINAYAKKISVIKEQYKALVGAEKYQTDLSNIQKEIQLTEQLNSAQQQDAQTKKQQQQQVNNIKNDLNSYLAILSETKKGRYLISVRKYI